MRKYAMVLSGITMMIVLGTVYSWSIFRVPLETELSLTTLESGLPYMSALFFYALAMYVSRRFIHKNTIRLILIVGSVLVGSGWFISSYITNAYLLALVLGVLVGSGVGLMYSIPMTIVPYWFKSHHGLIVGLILLGFGLSPFISARIAHALIESHGVFETFRYLGIAYGIILFALSFVFDFPKDHETKDIQTINPKEAFSHRSFKQLYVLFLVAVSIGLVMIGLSTNIGHFYIQNDALLPTLVTLFAVFNGVGRPIYGALLDKFDKKKIMMFSFVQILVASLLIILIQTPLVYTLSFSLFWLNLGGWLSIGPNVVMQTYGKDVFTSYYGILFTGYGFAALFGNLAAGYILDLFNHPTYLFGFVCVISVFILIFIHKSVNFSENEL